MLTQGISVVFEILSLHFVPFQNDRNAGANIMVGDEIASLTLAILTFGSCTLAYAIVNIFRKMPLQASIYASIYECVRSFAPRLRTQGGFLVTMLSSWSVSDRIS